jgi:MFS family permease
MLKAQKEVKKSVKQLKKDTMGLSVKEGSMASVAGGMGDSYIIPYALELNFNNFQIGLFKSLISLIPSIFQYYGSKLMEKWRRKKIIITFVTLQALMWFVVMSFAYLFWKNIIPNFLPYLLMFSYTLLAIFGSISGPAWFSLLGDIVPKNFRGRYFSKRNRICETLLLLAFLLGGFILDYFKTKGFVLVGFAILFALAGIFRLSSANMFRKHYDPKLKIDGKDEVSVKDFLTNISKFNFGRFSMFVTIFYFAIGIGGSFFSVYMLKDLNFSYVVYMLVSLSTSVFSLLSLPLWGKLSDRIGNKNLLTIGSVLISIMPFLWLFSKNPIYLALVPQLISGLGWSAFNLSSTNFVYDATPQHKRAFLLSYNNILLGIGSFVGSFIGGILAQDLPKFGFFSNLFILFIVSGILRTLTTLIFLPKVKEVRKVHPMHFNELRLMTIKTYFGHNHNLIIFKKLKELEDGLVKFPHNFLYKISR